MTNLFLGPLSHFIKRTQNYRKRSFHENTKTKSSRKGDREEMGRVTREEVVKYLYLSVLRRTKHSKK